MLGRLVSMERGLKAAMTDLPVKSEPLWRKLTRIPSWVLITASAAAVFIIVHQMILAKYPDADLRFRLDLSRLLTIPVVLKLHIASAVTAFLVGLCIFAGPKGRAMHRRLGWVWVMAMTSTAVSSFFLSGMNGRSFSWIHGLSAWTIIGLPVGIYAIRKQKNVQKHAKYMKGIFLGGMIIAGLFTFLPGRLMWSLFFTIS